VQQLKLINKGPKKQQTNKAINAIDFYRFFIAIGKT